MPAACCLAKRMRAALFFPPSLISHFFMCSAGRTKPAQKFLELIKSPESRFLWSRWKHQPFILLFTSLTGTIKLNNFTEEVSKFSSCILYQLRLMPLAMSNSKGKLHVSEKPPSPIFPVFGISELPITQAHHTANQVSKSTNSKRTIALMCK